MATLQEFERALINADKAGDMDAARTLAAEIRRIRASSATAIPGADVSQAQDQPRGIMDTLAGAGEAALSLGTGIVGGATGMLGGALGGAAGALRMGQFGTPNAAIDIGQQAASGAQRLTYEPRTQTGQDFMNPIADLMQRVLPAVALTPQLGMMAQGARQAQPAMSATMQAAMQSVAQRAQQAQAMARPAIQGVQEAITGIAAPTGGVTQPGSIGGSVGAMQADAAAQRIATAEGLPIPVQLTRGEAMRDPVSLGFEKAEIKMERGAKLRDRAEESGRALARNFDYMADQAGAMTPDAVSAGRPVVDALMAGHKEAKARTGTAYARWRKSDEASAVVDTNAPVVLEGIETPISFIDYLNQAPKRVATSSVTDAAKQYAINLGIAQGDDAFVVGNKVAARDLEAFRQQITGLAKWDDRVAIRDETILKKLIDQQLSPVAGPLLNEARKLRQQQAIKFENRATVARLINNKRGMDDPQVAVDKVFDRTVLNGSPEELTFLKRVLNTTGADGQQAWRELQGATLRHLQAEATKGVLDSTNQPIVSPAKLNQAIQALDKNGRLDVILGKERAQTVRDINDVSRWVSTVPPGTLVNSSGTALMLQAALLETAANGVLFGLPAPVLGALRAFRNQVNDNKIRAKIDRALNAKEAK